MPTHSPHWLDGARRDSSGGRTAPVMGPASGEVAQAALRAVVG